MGQIKQIGVDGREKKRSDIQTVLDTINKKKDRIDGIIVILNEGGQINYTQSAMTSMELDFCIDVVHHSILNKIGGSK